MDTAPPLIGYHKTLLTLDSIVSCLNKTIFDPRSCLLLTLALGVAKIQLNGHSGGRLLLERIPFKFCLGWLGVVGATSQCELPPRDERGTDGLNALFCFENGVRFLELSGPELE